ncbi:MAG: flagellar protein FlaG [Candidatus Riflebacteria bacterium]|nr:flagellar protein FlaG [Candidatus Riflebacteria bacterium]
MEVGNVKITGDPTTSYDPELTLPTTATPQPMEQEAAKAAQEQQDPQKQREAIEEAVEKMNKTAVIFDRSLRFQIHDKTKSTMVAVVDAMTDRVIREIPSKEVLDLFSKMQDYLGMIFDKKA